MDTMTLILFFSLFPTLLSIIHVRIVRTIVFQIILWLRIFRLFVSTQCTRMWYIVGMLQKDKIFIQVKLIGGQSGAQVNPLFYLHEKRS